MFWGNVDAVTHEQHLDNLRRAEQRRLVHEVEAANRQVGQWRQIKARLAGWMAGGHDSGTRQLADKAA